MLGNEHGTDQQPICQVSQNIGYQLYATLSAFYIPLIVMIFVYYKIYVAAKKVVEAELRAQIPQTCQPQIPLLKSSSSSHHHNKLIQSDSNNQNKSCPCSSDQEVWMRIKSQCNYYENTQSNTNETLSQMTKSIPIKSVDRHHAVTTALLHKDKQHKHKHKQTNGLSTTGTGTGMSIVTIPTSQTANPSSSVLKPFHSETIAVQHQQHKKPSNLSDSSVVISNSTLNQSVNKRRTSSVLKERKASFTLGNSNSNSIDNRIIIIEILSFRIKLNLIKCLFLGIIMTAFTVCW